ncbi:hypothetical protein AOC36_07810 [Erysipelothrix larvae]|uniref:Murein hydrolase transporter LrgA n=1 Tax=Erysipelothrix larvae TaxID=1514105 RepID=A0A0X8H0P2_9FIRM|nr:CidA/LrgA family protein [Erysipelothrix larvae]AMC93891.1 hypothetical protein AOC36_07810 [Erysipelothrix larvae]
MSIIVQLSVIFGFTLLGEVVASTLPFVFPGSVIGLLLLYTALTLKIVKIDTIEPTASGLKNNMAFFFVPLTVGLMESWTVFQDIMIPILVIVFVSTLLTLVISAKTTDALLEKEMEDDHA